MEVLEERPLATVLSRNWWVLLLRGLIAIVFAVLAWFRPGLSLAALVLLFGTYALVDGLLGVWTAIMGRRDKEDRWILLLWGLIGVVVGILTFVVPGVTTLALLFYIAIWAIASGVLEVVAAVRLRKEIAGEWLLVLGGLVSVVFGALLMAQPVAGALALLWMIAAFVFVFGVVLVVLAFEARGFGKPLSHA